VFRASASSQACYSDFKEQQLLFSFPPQQRGGFYRFRWPPSTTFFSAGRRGSEEQLNSSEPSPLSQSLKAIPTTSRPEIHFRPGPPHRLRSAAFTSFQRAAF
jgi:hypothetical protein